MTSVLKVKVLKFGGTSVADARARASSAQRVADTVEQGFRPVVVVSAIGRKGAPYATDTLIQELRDAGPSVPFPARDLDLIMACGEIVSAAIFAQALRSVGIAATPMTGMQAGISTDGEFGAARVTAVEPGAIREAIGRGEVPVICGFQGAPSASPLEITTLGRGGSDTTAAAIGAALGACAVEIYTDVDGIKTADPNWVPRALTLRQAGYDEVAEMAHLGAKVLHPRAAEIAMRHGIALWVKNSFSGDPGTEIVAEDVSYQRNVTGVTHSGKLAYLQFDLGSLSPECKAEAERRILEVLARFGINLYMANISRNGIGFGVNAQQIGRVERVLDGLVLPLGASTSVLQLGPSSEEVQAQVELLGGPGKVQVVKAERSDNLTMLSVIGRTYFGRPGVFYRILSLLREAGIQVLQTGDSDFSVSFLIPETEARRGVETLHAKLVESGAE